MKIIVHRCDGTIPGTETIRCDSYQRREDGFVTLSQDSRMIALFGPGFRGYIEIEYEGYDRGS